MLADTAIIDALKQHAQAESIPDLQRFFKTGPGQYGEGDVFIGVKMTPIRMVAKRFINADLESVSRLLDSPIHEHRMCALIILTLQYPRATDENKQNIYDLYLHKLHENRINNWDLVDVTCRATVGAHLYERARDPLFTLAKSANIWERRTAIISTFFFLAKGDASTTLEIATLRVHDQHDLMHKAVGWALREVGKRVDEALLTEFLNEHASSMPRTMLRYAIEHFSNEERRYYMTLR